MVIETYKTKELRRLESARRTEDGRTTGHYGDDAEAYRRDAREYWKSKEGRPKYRTFLEIKDKFREPEIFERFEIEGAEIIIAVTDTAFGPAVGGVRWNCYPTQEEAETDCRNLARGMQYKWLALSKILREEDRAKLFSGGKAVINDPYIWQTIRGGEGTVAERVLDLERLRRLFVGFGQIVNQMNGNYFTAPDMNTDTSVMDIIRTQTDFVKCLNGETGDPSPVTAEGVYFGLEALGKKMYSTLDGKKIVIHGAGKVGSLLAKRIRENNRNSRIVIVEKDRQRGVRLAEELDCEYSETGEKIDWSSVDIFSPNATGGIIDAEFARRLRPYSVVAGAANNQINQTEEEHVNRIFEKNRVLYAPDYVINMGGICNVVFGGANGKSIEIVKRVGDVLLEIAHDSEKTGEPTSEIADRMCETHYLSELERLLEPKKA